MTFGGYIVYLWCLRVYSLFMALEELFAPERSEGENDASSVTNKLYA